MTILIRWRELLDATEDEQAEEPQRDPEEIGGIRWAIPSWLAAELRAEFGECEE